MHAGSEEGGGTNANGIGLCQWTNGRHTNLVNYANSVGKSWTDVGVQLDFFWDHDKWQSNWWSGYHINTYDHSPESMSEDPPSGSYVEGSKRGFLAATDVKDAVRQFLYGWEVAGIPRLKVRYDAAERYLEALQNGGDADGDHGANGGAPANRRSHGPPAGNRQLGLCDADTRSRPVCRMGLQRLQERGLRLLRGQRLRYVSLLVP